MPRGDRTGPNGQGPMTGRRMGNCVGNNIPGLDSNTGGRAGFGRGMRNGFGRGFNQGFGRGMGRNFAFENQNLSNKEVIESELNVLKSQMEYLESELKKLD
jgi:hypothetical protein